MRRNIGLIDRGDVTIDWMVALEICAIRFLRKLVPLTREYTLSTGAFEPDPQPANSSKKVDKAESRAIGSH
jgi:hypothetical protein